MSLYLTNEQFFSQCGPAFSNQDPAVVTTACSWASGKADSYLGKRFTLPIVSFDDSLTNLVFPLALWKLATQIGFRPGSGQNDVIRVQYEDAIKELTQVSTGALELQGVIDSTPGIDEEGSLAASGAKLNFSMITGRCCNVCGFVSCCCGGGW